MGEWRAFDKVLNWLNTLADEKIDKKEVYKAVMLMKPDYYREDTEFE